MCNCVVRWGWNTCGNHPSNEKNKFFEIISKISKAAWDNLDISLGIGQGLSLEQEILGFSAGIGAYGNYGAWSFDHGKYSFGQEVYMGISISVLGQEVGAASRKYRELGQEYHSESWILINSEQSSLTIVGGAYYFLFFGVSYNIGFDPAGFLIDLDAILNKEKR